MYNVSEVANMLQVPEHTVIRFIKDGRLKADRSCYRGRPYSVSEYSFLLFLEQNPIYKARNENANKASKFDIPTDVDPNESAVIEIIQELSKKREVLLKSLDKIEKSIRILGS